MVNLLVLRRILRGCQPDSNSAGPASIQPSFARMVVDLSYRTGPVGDATIVVLDCPQDPSPLRCGARVGVPWDLDNQMPTPLPGPLGDGWLLGTWNASRTGSMAMEVPLLVTDNPWGC